MGMRMGMRMGMGMGMGMGIGIGIGTGMWSQPLSCIPPEEYVAAASKAALVRGSGMVGTGGSQHAQGHGAPCAPSAAAARAR